jgi:DNA-binding NtrC family response regulator
LVVDDLRSIWLTLGGILEYRGHNVVTVEDGYYPIEAVRKTHFNVIIVDIKMLGKRCSNLQGVKNIDPNASVIMMKGYTEDDLVKRAIDRGAYTRIYKPFNMEKVIELVENIAKSEKQRCQRRTLS